MSYAGSVPLIDVHSHYWEYPEHFSDSFKSQAKRARGDVEVDLTVRWNEYAERATSCDKTIVFGGKAKLSGLWVPDRAVAAYESQHPDKLLPFLSLDPTQPGWQDELQEGHRNLECAQRLLQQFSLGEQIALRCLRADRRQAYDLLRTGSLYRLFDRRDHAKSLGIAGQRVKFGRRQNEDALRAEERCGEGRGILHVRDRNLAGECVVTIRKHPHVYADVSAIHYRPFQLYHSLMLVQEYGVWHKLLFGSDYPFTTVDASLEGMRQLNDMLEGTKLPRLNMEKMEQMFQRDTLRLLRIA